VWIVDPILVHMRFLFLILVHNSKHSVLEASIHIFAKLNKIMSKPNKKSLKKKTKDFLSVQSIQLKSTKTKSKRKQKKNEFLSDQLPVLINNGL